MRTDATFAVGPDPTCVAAARRLVGKRCAGLSTPPDVEAIQLMVSELVTNVIRHTQTGEGELRVLLDDDALRIEVEDRGDGIPERPAVPDRRRGAGFGLNVVDRLADRWGVWDRNCIWFEMDLQTAAPASSDRTGGKRFQRHGGGRVLRPAAGSQPRKRLRERERLREGVALPRDALEHLIGG